MPRPSSSLWLFNYPTHPRAHPISQKLNAKSSDKTYYRIFKRTPARDTVWRWYLTSVSPCFTLNDFVFLQNISEKQDLRSCNVKHSSFQMKCYRYISRFEDIFCFSNPPPPPPPPPPLFFLGGGGVDLKAAWNSWKEQYDVIWRISKCFEYHIAYSFHRLRLGWLLSVCCNNFLWFKTYAICHWEIGKICKLTYPSESWFSTVVGLSHRTPKHTACIQQTIFPNVSHGSICYLILINITLKVFPMSSRNNRSTYVQVMAWRWT